MGCLMCVFLWFIAGLIVLKLYVKLTTGWCKSNVCLMGKTAIVTGGNSGIGYETAADFAKRGAKVILGCRNITRGEGAVKKLIESTKNPNIFFKQLDLCSFKSVREFAEDINKSEESSSGIGYETAADFAKRGAKVILGCRNITRGEGAVKKLIESTKNPNIFFKQLDLCSFKSVREFAEDINKSEERLDILVNNAGIGYTTEVATEDGLSYLLQANYFGHFLLTNLLLDILKRTKNSRIVNVSSLAAAWFVWYTSPFDLNELNRQPPRSLDEGTLYEKSKLCNLLFTIELAERLKGTTVTTYSLHPGLILTNIFSNLPYYLGFMFEIVIKWLFKDSREGAQTSIYCSVEQGIENLSGQHFHDCHVVGRYKTAIDPTLPKKLWKLSEKLVKLDQK